MQTNASLDGPSLVWVQKMVPENRVSNPPSFTIVSLAPQLKGVGKCYWVSNAPKKIRQARWWQLKYCFIFTPKLGEDFHVYSYLSDGLGSNHRPRGENNHQLLGSFKSPCFTFTLGPVSCEWFSFGWQMWWGSHLLVLWMFNAVFVWRSCEGFGFRQTKSNAAERSSCHNCRTWANLWFIVPYTQRSPFSNLVGLKNMYPPWNQHGTWK